MERYVDGSTEAAIKKVATRLTENLPKVPASDEEEQEPAGEHAVVPVEVCEEVAELHLRSPDFNDAVDRICQRGYYEREEVEEAISALNIGNLFIAGPPGTGKTRLARELANVFSVKLIEATANPEWSVYDVLGTQTLESSGAVKPKLGVVTDAIVQCCTTIRSNQEDPEAEPNQAVWLLMDEINRAEIDRAFGPLFTALAHAERPQLPLDFCDPPTKITIPRRFRLLATLNSFDMSFVNTMSAALRRRFGRVSIIPPSSVGDSIPEREMKIARQEAEALLELHFPGESSTMLDDVDNLIPRLSEFFAFVRDGSTSSLPLGTAHFIDVLAYVATLARAGSTPSDEDAGWALADRALAARLTSSLETDSTRLRLPEMMHDLESKFGAQLPRTLNRMRAFLGGTD